MLEVWCVLAPCSVSSVHWAILVWGQALKQDNILNPRAVCLRLYSCTVWFNDAVLKYLSSVTVRRLTNLWQMTYRCNPYNWLILIRGTIVKNWSSVQLTQNLLHKSRFSHKLLIFVNDCKYSVGLHHDSHKLNQILISCVKAVWQHADDAM